MVLPNRQIARSFFGFAVPGLSGGQSASFVNRFTHSLAGAVLLVLLTLFAVVANAADLTWDNGAATGNWNTTDANFTGLWSNGNTAVFGGPTGSTITINASGITADSLRFSVNNQTVAGDPASSNVLGFTTTSATMNVTVDSGLTATAGSFQGPAASTGAGNKIAVLGGGTLNLNGTNNLVTGNTDNAQSAGVTVNGGSTLNVTGTLYAMSPLATNRASFTNLVGDSSASNTVNISGSGVATAGAWTVGGSTFGGNSVNLTAPGTTSAPTLRMIGSSPQFNLGVSSSNNSYNLSNGAIATVVSAGGIGTWTIGTNAGANSNAITVSGANTVLSRSLGGSYLNVGAAGDNNSITIQNGGTFITGRLAAGSLGGDGNVAKVTGAGSLIYTNAGSNAFFDVGTTTGSLNNAFKVEAGAKFNYTGTGTGKYATVGVNVGADSNFIQVTGVGSTMNVNFGLPIGIGAKATGTALTAGGNSNSLNVYDGGAFTTVSPIYVGATVALGGAVSTGNSVNLGNGTSNTASLTVGASAAQFNAAAGYDGAYTVPGTTIPVAVQANSYTVPSTGSLTTQGINLIDSSSVLTFNNGRLVAGGSFSGTPLVSGLGGISLAGPAYFSVGGTNSIANAISGLGSLTKEGVGSLTLSGLNTYSGDTLITAGTLSISSSYLSDLAAVKIDSGAFFNLGFSGSDSIGSLWLGGLQMAGGTYDSSTATYGSYFTGNGSLVVPSVVPEPGTLVLLFTGLAFAGFSWRKRLASSRNSRQK